MADDAHVCPTAVELYDFARDPRGSTSGQRIEGHLASCVGCTRITRTLKQREPRSIPSGAAPPAELLSGAGPAPIDVRAALRAPRPIALSAGQIWTTRLPAHSDRVEELDAEPRIVVIIDPRSGDPASVGPLVVPISLERANRAGFDLSVDATASPLGYGFTIQAWNGVTMLAEQLGRCVGTLPEALARDVALLYRGWRGDAVPLDRLVERVGPPIKDDADPRIAFQEREAESLAYLRGPALRRLGRLEEEEAALDEEAIETVGDLLKVTMSDLSGLAEPDRLRAAWSDERSVRDLLDANRRVGLLSSLMGSLGIDSAERRRQFVERLLQSAVSLQPGASEREPERLYARRQAGRHDRES